MTEPGALGFFAGLGDEIPRRPRPSMRGALAAVGGSLFAVGLLVMAGDKLAEGSKGLPIVLALVAVAAGYGVIFGLGTAEQASDAIAPFAVAAVSVGAAAAGFLLAFDFDDAEITLPVLVATVALVAVYLVPGTRGRPVPLGLALAGVWVLLIDATTDSTSASFDGGASAAEDGSLVSLIYGVVLLGVAFWLDKSERHGVLATPFVAIGNLAYIVGTFGVVGTLDGATGNSLLVVAAGLVLSYVGAAGVDRRFTTWVGATGVFFGASAFVASVFEDSDSPVTPGLSLAVLGLVIAAVAVFWDMLRSTSDRPSGVGGGGGAWHADPTGRYEQRYWDGNAWTAHVSSGGQTQVDPYGVA